MNKIHSRAAITNPCMFEHRGSFNTKESCYYDVFTEMIEILNFKFLKCIKLITINLQCCNINSIKSIKISRSSYSSCLQMCGSCILTSVSIIGRNLVLVECMQCIVSDFVANS